uniref:Uncharacterized protein n=1 Tax=Octopus bimaculoides TaxID=37653 RepID=A0A0L8FXY5_OCTBM
MQMSVVFLKEIVIVFRIFYFFSFLLLVSFTTAIYVPLPVIICMTGTPLNKDRDKRLELVNSFINIY